MYRISPNNPVRRRLFADVLDDQARVENFANALQESSAEEKLEKMRKWNFDFEKELPLEGVYKWYRVGDPDWIGVQAPKFTCVAKSMDEDGFLPLKYENELTPRSDRVESQTLPLRKRRKEMIENLLAERAVKRKITF
ncbi:unnamed protein product, partial [Iphiclides podalirius]